MNSDNNQETQDAINIFAEECSEILENFGSMLIEYEKNKNSKIITDLKRNIHSLKGSAGILGLNEIQKSAHKIEDLLAEISNKKNDEFKNCINELLELSDEIKLRIEKTVTKYSKSKENILDDIINNIYRLKTDKNVSGKLISLVSQLKNTDISAEFLDIVMISEKILNEINASSKIKDFSVINVLSGSFKTLKKILSENGNNSGLIFTKQKLDLTCQMIDGYLEKKADSTENKEFNGQKQPKLKKRINIEVLDNIQQGAFRTLRVETSKIDKLYDYIQYIENELFEFDRRLSDVLFSQAKLSKEIQNSEKCISSLLNSIKDDNLNSGLQVLKNNIDNMQNTLKTFNKQELCNKETENGIFEKIFEIKKDIKNIRTLPIGVILHMFPRMARDIAANSGKEIEFEISGGQITVDKTIIEEIKMPLLHILRNAVGHGTEPPEEREKIGKPKAGKIEISVKQDDNTVIISVKDDGRGINTDKIKEKAIKDKIIDISEADKMTETDLTNIIFRPGFSTEDNVTELSGRGMGLDIVNNKVKNLNGEIKILTEKGKGTEFILSIPSDKNINITNPHKKQIILVDDSPVTRIYFSKILNNGNYHCICYGTAESALSYLKNNSCDLIITDIEMPETNGYEFVRILKNENINIPVLVISMMNEKQAAEKFKEIKIEHFINKADFSEEKILKTIEEIIK